MAGPADNKCMLPADGLESLLRVRHEIQDECQGKLPDPLAQATVAVVMRLARRRSRLRIILSPEVLALVRKQLRHLARRGWKADTSVLLCKRPKTRDDRESPE